jgi:transcriptional regulator with XRE-family HTH domain
MSMMRKGKQNNDVEYQRLVEEETLIFEATEVIAELLEEQQVTRKELADKLGRSKGFVTQVLAGDRNMTLRTLANLSFALERRIELQAAPLETKADSGGEAGISRTPEVRVRLGIGDMRTRSQCCGTAHPGQWICPGPGQTQRRTFLGLGSLPRQTAVRQMDDSDSTMAMDSEPEIERIAG